MISATATSPQWDFCPGNKPMQLTAAIGLFIFNGGSIGMLPSSSHGRSQAQGPCQSAGRIQTMVDSSAETFYCHYAPRNHSTSFNFSLSSACTVGLQGRNAGSNCRHVLGYWSQTFQISPSIPAACPITVNAHGLCLIPKPDQTMQDVDSSNES